MRQILLVLSLLLAPGCAFARSTNNEPLDVKRLQALHPGTTTAQEAVELLGAPLDVVQLGKRSAYRYEYTCSKQAVLFLLVINFWNQDTRADRVWLFFDENQLLTHVGTTLSGDDNKYAMPWEDVHE